jgi:hypothetical protein
MSTIPKGRTESGFNSSDGGNRIERTSKPVNLIQVLLPLCTDRRENSKHFRLVRHEVASRFGGLALYRNAPAEAFGKMKGRLGPMPL